MGSDSGFPVIRDGHTTISGWLVRAVYLHVYLCSLQSHPLSSGQCCAAGRCSSRRQDPGDPVSCE